MEVLRPCYGGQVNEVPGMIKVERWPESTGRNRRTLRYTLLSSVNGTQECAFSINFTYRGGRPSSTTIPIGIPSIPCTIQTGTRRHSEQH